VRHCAAGQYDAPSSTLVAAVISHRVGVELASEAVGVAHPMPTTHETLANSSRTRAVSLAINAILFERRSRM
jgi:hypothetical protein